MNLRRLQLSNVWNAHLLVCVTLVAGGCSTPQYRQAESGCRQVSYEQFPQKIEEYRCEQVRYVKVQTGETECITEPVYGLAGPTGQVKTTCTPITVTRPQTYISTCRRDVNKPARNNWVLNCTAKACLSAFGNIDCKTK